MAPKIHRIKPTLSCKKQYKNYRQYKPYLKADFNNRCGYCDDDDFFVGGSRGFHIDHYRPQKYFPELKTEYANLVYCCPYCNLAKSDNWREEKGLIHPCNTEYDKNLYRTNRGKLKHYTEQGKYICDQLKLWLKRHELIWLIGKLEAQKKEVHRLIEILQMRSDGSEELNLLRKFKEIQDLIDQYQDCYKKTI